VIKCTFTKSWRFGKCLGLIYYLGEINLKHPDLKIIPEEWKLTQIDKLFSIQQGKQVSQKNRIGNNQFPFLRTKNIFWGKIDLSELDNMNFSEQEIQKLNLSFNDLLVCEGGDVGRTAIWKNQKENCFYQNHLHRLRVIGQKEVEPHFVLYWFWYAFQIGKIYFGRSNVTTIPNLSKSRLGELPLPLPPLPEQKKIAYILSTVQRAIEEQERLIQVTTELKKALMHKLFTEGTRGEPQKETEIGLVPESWEVVPLGKYAKILNGFAFKSKDYNSSGIRLIRISNVSHGFLVDKDDKYLPYSYIDKYSEYALHKGDLIISLTRPIIKDGMKYCYIRDNHLPALLNQRVGKIEVINDRLLKNYLYHIIFSPYFIEPLKVMAEGSNQPNVSPTRIEKFLIPIPSNIDEQKEIALLLTLLTDKIEQAKMKILNFNNLFRTLLHQLMTAQLRVHEIDFELLTSIERDLENAGS